MPSPRLFLLLSVLIVTLFFFLNRKKTLGLRITINRET